jgi:two-component system NarL family response regulator
MESAISENGAASQARPVHVLIADESPVVREGLSSLLGKQPGIKVVAKVHPADDIIQVIGSLSPEVILLDLAPSAPGLLEVIGKILANRPTIRIVVFTNSLSEEHIHESFQAGAKGYLHKSSSLEDILTCIRAVAVDQVCIPQNIAQILARRRASPSLTRREQEVLRQMAMGKSNKKIGLALQMSEGTVKVHVTHILEKLKVAGRTEALASAAARGLVSLQMPSIRQQDFPRLDRLA